MGDPATITIIVTVVTMLPNISGRCPGTGSAEREPFPEECITTVTKVTRADFTDWVHDDVRLITPAAPAMSRRRWILEA
jgi:hypothetical protein